jgi:very-short-patch-repair endonuclease
VGPGGAVGSVLLSHLPGMLLLMTSVLNPMDQILELAGDGRVPRVIGYRAATWTYGLDGVAGPYPEFLIPHGARPRGPFDHQRRRMEDIEIVYLDGVAITSVRQTLADLCAVAHPDVVERAVESALRLKLVTELELRDFAYLFTFARHGGPALRAVLDRRPIGAPPTGSDLETICLQVYRYGGVRIPQRQYPVLDLEGEWVATSDFGFPPKAFVVETDGFATHAATRVQQQYDLNRQNRILDTGHHLRRFTYLDVTTRPLYVCRATLRGLDEAPLLHRR